jgi:hypothetical protein
MVRIEDLGPGDFVKVECAACGHAMMLTAAMLATAGVGPNALVVDLEPRLRCQECKGKALVSIRWGRLVA